MTAQYTIMCSNYYAI